MNLLCFSNDFVNQEDIKTVKKLSCYFVRKYISENNKDAFLKLLKISGDITQIDTFTKYMNEYYNSMGIKYTPTNILYRQSGDMYSYVARNKYACFFITHDWQDSRANDTPMIYDNFLNKNYADTKKFYEVTTTQMKSYQEFFNMDSYNNELEIYFINDENENGISYYDRLSHKIYLITIASIMHEYIHSLTIDYCKDELWSVEGFAVYYTRRYDEYGLPFDKYSFANLGNTNYEIALKKYFSSLNRKYDVLADFNNYLNIIAYSNIKAGRESYGSSASFIAFLADKYGDEFTINYCCKKNGKYAKPEISHNDLLSEWKTYIVNNFSVYYENK